MDSIVVNSKLLNLRQSATVLINQQVKDLRAQGKQVYHFGFGQSPFEVHESVQKALCEASSQKLYLPTKGLASLREAISQFVYKHFAMSYDADHIIVGPGSKQLLYQASAIIEGPILLPTPSWVSYAPQAEILGKTLIPIRTSKFHDYKLTPEDLENVCEGLEHKQKILLMNSPHNPTGSVYQPHEVKEIVEVCRRFNVVILSDEIYAYIDFSGSAEKSFAYHYPEGTMVTGGLSKAFHAGGYRLGFLAAPHGKKDLIDCMGVMASQTYTSVSAPIQYAALEAYSNPAVAEYARECSFIHQATSQYLYERLIKMNLGCVKPEGAFYLFPDMENFKPALKTRNLHSSGRLCRHLLDNFSVAVLPASVFSYPQEYLAFRIAATDYDGEKAYRAFKQGDELNDQFVRKYCPNLEAGISQIEKFVSELN
ncbi:MAG: pyridoxal phosphate-dependent aminotransferase [Bdellovibrionota bacterium]